MGGKRGGNEGGREKGSKTGEEKKLGGGKEWESELCIVIHIT